MAPHVLLRSRYASSSVLSPGRTHALGAQEVLPALLQVVRCGTGPAGAAHKAARRTAAMPRPFPLLPMPRSRLREGTEAVVLAGQQRCTRRLLKVLWRSAFPAQAAAGAGPFEAFPGRRVEVQQVEEEEEEQHAGAFPGQILVRRVVQYSLHAECAIAASALRRDASAEARRFLCSPSSPGYLRLALANKRPGSSRRVRVLAHRLVCWVFNGPPPGGQWDRYVAGHLCGRRTCLCPFHLTWMTRQEDAQCREWHKRDRAQEEPAIMYPGRRP